MIKFVNITIYTIFSIFIFRSVRVIDMNEPITIERAQVGRAMYFPFIEWEAQISSKYWDNQKASRNAFQLQEAENPKCGSKERKMAGAVFFNRVASSQIKIKLPKKDRHHHMHMKVICG